MEREIIGRMQEGNRRDDSDPMLVSPQVRIATEDRHPELNASQRQAVDEIFLSREKVVGLDGIAGAGKTTTLSVIRKGAEAESYRVEGFAPTSRSAVRDYLAAVLPGLADLPIQRLPHLTPPAWVAQHS